MEKMDSTVPVSYTHLHVDSPRMDIKQNPLYEKEGMAYLDTHYYGGIKKYQWVTLPLAIHGVIVKKDGTTIDVNIGEKPEDPVFCVTDLLIHLASAQMEKMCIRDRHYAFIDSWIYDFIQYK